MTWGAKVMADNSSTTLCQRLAPLGDQALLAYCPDEFAAVRLAKAIRKADPPWLQDVVPAYASVGIYFDADQIRLREVSQWIQQITDEGNATEHEEEEAPCHVIPVCYELNLDLERVSRLTGQTPEGVIAAHLSVEYRVYAIGFSPGFPYLGYLPAPLSGVPRLETPRLRVEAGSVGIAGRQTGLYPLPRPGGWNILGRTPLVCVDLADGFFPIRVGDRVRFQRIDERQFEEILGERLPTIPRHGG